MENLTNEQIIDIINFYKLCGITEDMYLSADRVLDLFTLLGISPEYDENGERKLTVYEQLGIAPKFRDGKEVPIIFAIKHKISKIIKDKRFASVNFVFVGAGEKKKDKTILNQLKKDYFSAVSNGNMSEATRIYDMIDLMTGGKADYFIAVQYNCVKFYKKMQKQLLIDMFANFVILMILTHEEEFKNGVVKFDKLYKSFMEKEVKKFSLFQFGGNSISAPKLSNITVNFSNGETERTKKITIKTSAKQKGEKIEEKFTEEIKLPEEENQNNLISFVKSKINVKINHLKDNLSKISKQKERRENEERLLEDQKLKQQEFLFEQTKINETNKSEKVLSVLENN